MIVTITFIVFLWMSHYITPRPTFKTYDIILIGWFISIYQPIDSTNIIFGIRILTILLSVIFVLSRIKRRNVNIHLNNYKWLILFSAYSFVTSIFFFETENVILSFEYLTFILFLIFWASEKTTKSLYLILLKIALFICIGGLVSKLINPELAYSIYNYDDRGVTDHSSLSSLFPRTSPNSLSQAAALILILITLWPYKKSKNVYIAMFIIGILVLYFSRSRTSIFFIIMFFTISQLSIKNIIVYVTLFFFFAVTFIDEFFSYILRGQGMNLFLSGSGRIKMWEYAIEAINKNIIIGSGYRSKITNISDIIEGGVSSYDNTYLDVYFYGGIIGLGLILTFIIKTFNLVKIGRFKSSLLFWFFSLILIRSLTGPTFHTVHLNTVFIILLIQIINLEKIGKPIVLTPKKSQFERSAI